MGETCFAPVDRWQCAGMKKLKARKEEWLHVLLLPYRDSSTFQVVFNFCNEIIWLEAEDFCLLVGGKYLQVICLKRVNTQNI